jgi:acetoin utilization deacetylase AcuC-like enzyme
MLDPDTFTSRETASTALLAAGGAVVAIDRVLDLDGGADEQPPAALVMARPPGHHALASRAMGFCLFNNVAVAAAHALGRGLTRIAVVDYDVHHGNGTQQSFYDDPRVLFVSTHQYPFYPGSGAAEETGRGEGAGFTVNVPIESGATDGDYQVAFERVVLPVLDAYRPELLIVSAGFDPHMHDPLASMRMSVAGLNELGRQLRDYARANGRPVVFVTEGGYHLKVLGACLDGLVRLLADVEADDVSQPDAAGASAAWPGPDPLRVDDLPLVDRRTAEPSGRGAAAVELVRTIQSRFWPGL